MRWIFVSGMSASRNIGISGFWRSPCWASDCICRCHLWFIWNAWPEYDRLMTRWIFNHIICHSLSLGSGDNLNNPVPRLSIVFGEKVKVLVVNTIRLYAYDLWPIEGVNRVYKRTHTTNYRSFNCTDRTSHPATANEAIIPGNWYITRRPPIGGAKRNARHSIWKSL